MPKSDIAKQLWANQFTPDNVIALRGYLTEARAPGFWLKLDGNPLPKDLHKDVSKQLANAGLVRLYLSARFDRYVDFPEDQLVASFDPIPPDDTTIVWLRGDGHYLLVTETPLDADFGFVRGELVDDFMGQPEAQTAWEEQRFGTGKNRTHSNCYA